MIWQTELEVDPVPTLLSSGNAALTYWTKRDLLEEGPTDPGSIWESPEVSRVARRQREDGSWPYPIQQSKVRSQLNYDQIETYRVFAQLVEKYALTREHPIITNAAEFLFRFQTRDGDFRGIYGNQYTPNYSAGIMELLIKAGYGGDRRIAQGFTWLLGIRQSDGGWAIPFRTANPTKTLANLLGAEETAEPDRSQPFSHCITGVVLRAFAAHPQFRNTPEAIHAGQLLVSRFFKPDRYPDRKSSSFWTRFSFPFWFTDLVSSLDSLSLVGLSRHDSQIEAGLNWLRHRQAMDGSWQMKMVRGGDKDLDLWFSLAVCRVFKRFYG
jgi:hypothetical protein